MKKRIFAALAMLAAAAVMLFGAPETLPGTAKNVEAAGETYTVSVRTGYLALRTAMAYDSRNEIGELLKESNRKFGQTLILITHDENIALQADRIIYMEDGNIVKDDRIRNTDLIGRE